MGFRRAAPLAAVLAVGCGGGDGRAPGVVDGRGGRAAQPGGGAAGNAGTGGVVGDGVVGSGGAPPPCPVASAPFGTDPSAGESFPDLEVARCDGSRLTLDRFRCEAKLTVFSIGAGWCQPCIDETPLLQDVYDRLSREGVLVVQILFQDASSMPATTLFCESWVADAGNNWPADFDLAFPVTIDPAGNTLSYFDVAVTPLNVIVNRDGMVLWAETGEIPSDLEATLRSLLE